MELLELIRPRVEEIYQPCCAGAYGGAHSRDCIHYNSALAGIVRRALQRAQRCTKHDAPKGVAADYCDWCIVEHKAITQTLSLTPLIEILKPGKFR